MAVYANIEPESVLQFKKSKPTPVGPVHVSVSAKTPLVPPLAEGRRTQKGGEWRSQVSSSDLCPPLNLEEWFLEQLTRLYDCQEEEIPELEIDVDELLDMESDDTRAARVKELLVDCYKPTEAFISGLLDKIRGMQKLSTPQKK
nr:PREDICTED: protein phosphatase 1 regulatory subunit 14B [Bos mutus]